MTGAPVRDGIAPDHSGGAPAILVLHAPGDPAAGRPWRDALAATRWEGPVLAPDLPGHGEAPPPVGGDHELADAAFEAMRTLVDAGLSRARPVVVGVGANGWAAQLLALGGRARALVLVDGLGSPWVTAEEGARLDRERMRALSDDPAALAPHTGGGLDPRLAHGPHPHGSRDLALRAARAVAVPTLVVESPRSTTPAADRDALRAEWSAPVEIALVPDTDAPTVVDALVAWWTTAAS